MINQKTPSHKTRSEQRRNDQNHLPKARMIIRKRLKLSIEVQSQERRRGETFRRVPAGERLHGMRQFGTRLITYPGLTVADLSPYLVVDDNPGLVDDIIPIRVADCDEIRSELT